METTNTGTTWAHEPYDGCDGCDRSLMAVALAERDAGAGAPIKDVFEALDK